MSSLVLICCLCIMTTMALPYRITSTNSTILQYTPSYTKDPRKVRLFVQREGRRHRIFREEFHRFGIIWDTDSFRPITLSQLKSIPLGILFKYVALEGARLLQVRNDIDQHIYLLLDGVLRYMNPIDANHLILAKDLDRSLLFRPYRGPTAIDKVPRSYFNRFPIGDPYNDLSFDNPPAKPSLGVILTNTMMSFSDSSPFNPSMVQLPNGSHLITNRLLVVRQTVTELYLRQPSHNGNNTPLNVTTHLTLRWRHDKTRQLFYDTFKCAEDARLFRVNNGVYFISTNHYILNILRPWDRRKYFMLLGRLEMDAADVFLTDGVVLDSIAFFPTKNRSTIAVASKKEKKKQRLHQGGNEKNWSPFVYSGRIFLSYAVNPHVVLNYTHSTRTTSSTGIRTPSELLLSSNESISLFDLSSVKSLQERQRMRELIGFRVEPVQALYNTSFNDSFWTSRFGEMRGGTPAVRLNDSHHIAAFHSSYYRVKGGHKWHSYVMGIYLFQSSPPFRIVAVSEEPLGQDVLYFGQPSQLYKELAYCIFPMNLEVMGDGKLQLSYGRNNEEFWVANMSTMEVLRRTRRV